MSGNVLLLLLLFCIFPFTFRALHFDDQTSVLYKILTKIPIRHWRLHFRI